MTRVLPLSESICMPQIRQLQVVLGMLQCFQQPLVLTCTMMGRLRPAPTSFSNCNCNCGHIVGLVGPDEHS